MASETTPRKKIPLNELMLTRIHLGEGLKRIVEREEVNAAVVEDGERRCGDNLRLVARLTTAAQTTRAAVLGGLKRTL